MKTIEIDFLPEENVTIDELDMAARVRSVRINHDGVSYLVTYWADSQQREAWVSRNELSGVSK